MSIGYYSSIKSSTVQAKDVDIYYTYLSSRNSTPDSTVTATKLEATSILKPVVDNTQNLLGGSYNLTLPSDVFNNIGVYNIFILPKKVDATIIDCGVLASDSTKRGIVLDISESGLSNISEYLVNDGLVGFTIEYYDSNNILRPNLFRVVTSCNLCEPIADNLPNSVSKQIKYRFNDNATLLFLTVTPSSTPSVKPTSKPYIGNANDKIRLTNSFFEPLVLEVEFVEYGIQEIGYALYGSQTKSVADGIVTVYDNENKIYKQLNTYDIQDEFGVALFNVREKRTLIDESKDFENITNFDL